MLRCLFLLSLAITVRAESPVELKYIPADYPAAVTIDAAKLIKDLATLGVPVEKQLDKLKTEKGIDLAKAARLSVLMKPFPGGNMAFSPLMVVTTKAADAKAELPKWLESTAEETVAGQKAIKAKEQMAKTNVFGTTVSDTAAVIAMEPTFVEAFTKADKDAPLAKEYAAAKTKADVTLIVAMKPLMAALKKEIPDIDSKIPSAAESFWAAAKKLEAATLAVDLAGDELVKGVFRAETAEGAAEVKAALQGGVALMALALPQIKQQLSTQLPEDARKPVIAVIEALAKESKFATDKATVTWTVARPKGIK